MRTLLVLLSLSLLATSARAEKILIVGDSISCGPFGDEMVKHLTEAGHQVTLFCSVSSAPRDWLKGKNVRKSDNSPETWPCQTRRSGSTELGDCDGSTQMPKFSDILVHHPSDRVMIALGTNSLPDGPDISYLKMLDAIADSGRACDWIGPPHLQPQKAYDTTKDPKNKLTPAQLIKKKTAAKDRLARLEASLNDFYDALTAKVHGTKGKGCDLLDSREATAPGTPGNETNEGLHSTTAAAKYRYQQMSIAIKRALANSSAPKAVSASTTKPGVR